MVGKDNGFLRRLSRWWVGIPYIWLILFLLCPLILIVTISFSQFQFAVPPYKSLFSWVDQEVFTVRIFFSNYKTIMADSLYLWSYVQAIMIAFITTFLCFLLGYPMAYYIYLKSMRLRFLFLLFALLPFWTSFLLRVYGWMNLLSFHGVLNQYLMQWGWIDKPFKILGTYPCVLLGMVYCYLPFMILPLYLALERIERPLVEAAYDLGCRPMAVFWKLIFPLSYPGIVVGSSLVFIPAVGEYIIPELLGGSRFLVIGRIIWEEFFSNVDWPMASALAVVMIIVLLFPILIFEKLQNHAEKRVL
jgi:putrescine transport system permease protein